MLPAPATPLSPALASGAKWTLLPRRRRLCALLAVLIAASLPPALVGADDAGRNVVRAAREPPVPRVDVASVLPPPTADEHGAEGTTATTTTTTTTAENGGVNFDEEAKAKAAEVMAAVVEFSPSSSLRRRRTEKIRLKDIMNLAWSPTTSSVTTTTSAEATTTASTTTAKKTKAANAAPVISHGDAIVYQPKRFPCESSSSSIHASEPRGIYYVKVPKTNSTHWRDVALKSALHTSDAAGRYCYRDASHMNVAESNLFQRDRKRSLLFTFVRDVREWKVAEYYHRLAKRYKARPSADGMVTNVQRHKNGQADYIRTLPSFGDYGYGDSGDYGVSSSNSARGVARAILKEYDFIGIANDPDRSLVVYRLLFGLPPEAVLYNPSSLAGTISFRSGDRAECQPVRPNVVYPEARSIMEGGPWKEDNEIDLALVDEARRSLEATIDLVLGRERFNEALFEHRALMAKVRERCLPVVQYRCNENGKYNGHGNDDCSSEGGCGYECIHDLVLGKI